MAQGIAWLGVTEVGPGSVLGGIYVDATQMRPADFREVRERIDWLRRSHYLDGPTTSTGSSATSCSPKGDLSRI